MKEKLRTVFHQFLKEISEGTHCDEISCYMPCVNPILNGSNPLILGAVESRRENVFNWGASFRPGLSKGDPFSLQQVIYYNPHLFILRLININEDFINFLTRDYVLKISEIYDISLHPKPVKYAKMLFHNFIHDGIKHPYSIEDVNIADHVEKINSARIIKKYQEECDLYNRPTHVFQKKYEVWDMHNRVMIDNVFYPIAQPKTIRLDATLESQCVTPLLQYLIKLWIIHQCVINPEVLKSDDFFDVPNVESVLAKLQHKIGRKIRNILDQRRKFILDIPVTTCLKDDRNLNALSSHVYDLTQRISLTKLFFGFANYDIHYYSNKKDSYSEKVKFYLNSYANTSSIKYLWSRCVKNVNKPFLGGPFNLIESIYIMMWLPFLATYLTITGLSSTPFNFIRKKFSAFGNNLDKILTVLEAGKDSYLLYLSVPLLYKLFTTVCSLSLFSLHVTIAATTYVAFIGAGIIDYVIRESMASFAPPSAKKCSKKDIEINCQNLNHTHKFRQLLGKLIGKIETGSCDINDEQLLVSLHQCQLNPDQKKQLQSYVENKITDNNVEEKATYSLALHQMKKGAYLPSWKLIQRLHRDIEPENTGLKKTVDRIHEIYNKNLIVHM